MRVDKFVTIFIVSYVLSWVHKSLFCLNEMLSDLEFAWKCHHNEILFLGIIQTCNTLEEA